MEQHSPPGSVRGLTADQVRERQARGQVNRVAHTVSRPLSAILRGNLLTFFNAVLAGAVLLLLAVGQFRDAFLIGALVCFSVIISMAQEVRAKLRLDQIALLARAPVRVLRDGREEQIDPAAVVLGDYLTLGRGEQVVADGKLVRSESLEMDESLLSGEAEPVDKRVDDEVLSGSFCLSGSGVYVATRVGAASHVQGLTAAARQYRSVRTPLQRFLDRVLRVLLIVVGGLSALQATAFLVQGASLVDAVRATAVIATLVPQGLLLMSTVAYSLGALRLARHRGLVQELNAVESLSNVDVLCIDKTGTLTQSRLALSETVSVGEDRPDLKRLLGRFAASSADANSTIRAIASALPAQPVAVQAAAPFRAERQWSALTFATPQLAGSYFLGAPEVLLPHAVNAGWSADQVEARARAGERVLLFAWTAVPKAWQSPGGAPALPAKIELLALVALEEELRPAARDTLTALAKQGVALKIISGDHPLTVRTLARRLGLPESTQAVASRELAGLSPAAFAETVEQTTIFGRTTPQQKQQIIRALKGNRHYVAMVGDGANDVLALKEAQLGIAMQSGSPAARGVAGMVLLQDDFDVLPRALDEGRRIVGSILLLIKLFLIRDVGTIELILATGFVGVPFPLLPPHVTLIALLTVGVPALFLVAWAEPAAPKRDIAPDVARFALSLGSAIGLSTMSVYVFTWLALGEDVGEARAAVVAAAVLSGLIALLLIQSPLRAPARRLVRDRRTLWLAGGLALAYLGLQSLPTARRYFELQPLVPINWAVVLAVVVVCFGSLHFVLRHRLHDRLLD